MKKTALLLVLLTWTCFQLVYGGSITIINQNPNYTYSGQLIATNNPSAPADANASYSYVTVALMGSPGSTVTHADPTTVPGPFGPVVPVASGVFIGIKGGCAGVPLDGTVGRAGTYLGYPQTQNQMPYFFVIWTPTNATDVVVTIF